MKKLPLLILGVLVFVVLVNSVPPDNGYPWTGKWLNESGEGIAGINARITVEIIMNATAGTYCECVSTADIVSVNVPFPDGSYATTTGNALFKWNGQGNSSLCGVGPFAIGNDCSASIDVVHRTYANTTNASNLGYQEGYSEPYYQTNSSCYFENVTLIKNDPPNITGIPDNWTYEDTVPLWEIDLWNYTIDDRDNFTNLTFAVIVHNTTLINAVIKNGRYLNFSQPGANLTGSTLVTVIVTDTGGLSDNHTFNMTVVPVNDPPIIDGCTNPSVNEDNNPPDNWVNLDACTTDVDNTTNELVWTILSQTNASLIDCSIADDYYINCSNPAANQTGASYLNVSVTDGEYNDSTIITVTVNPSNDPPWWNITPPNFTISEDSGVNNLINLSGYGVDVETPADQLTYVVSSENTGEVNCNIIGGTDLTATPALNWNGIAQCGLKVYDGALYSAEFTVYINVTPVNDPPVINDANITVLLNTPKTLDLIDLLNYSDADVNDTSIFTLVGTAPNGTNFTITDNASGIAQFIANQAGIFNFTINVTDSGGLSDTAVLTVNAISMDVIVVKIIEAIGENEYQTTVTVYNYNNESKNFKNLTLTDPELGANVTFDLDYRSNVYFKNNITLPGEGIIPFSIAKVYNPSLGTIYYSNEESVYITECPSDGGGCGGGGGGGGGGGMCPPCEPCEPEPCEPEPCEELSECEECRPSVSRCGARCELFECNAGYDNLFRFEVVDKIVECDGRIIYKIRVRNNNNKALSYVAIGVPDVALPEDGSIYSGEHNDYNVENPTNNPFYSIKFETIGEGIKNGDFDIFELVLDYNPGDFDIQIQAKAGRLIGTTTLYCSGETCKPCGLVGQAFRFTEGGFWLWPLLLLLLLLLRPQILIIDTRDTFRSMSTKYLVKQRLRKRNVFNYIYWIRSGGAFALNNKRPSKWVVEFGRLKKLNIKQHKTKTITENMVKWARRIVVMEKWHKEFIIRYGLNLRPKKELESDVRFLRIKLERIKKYKNADLNEIKAMREKINTLRKEIKQIEKLEDKIWILDVKDPVGKDVTEYGRCFDEIKKKTKDDELLDWLQGLHKEELEKAKLERMKNERKRLEKKKYRS